jgi:hypothetical protein
MTQENPPAALLPSPNASPVRNLSQADRAHAHWRSLNHNRHGHGHGHGHGHCIRRRRSILYSRIGIFDIRNDIRRTVHWMIVEVPITTRGPPIAAPSEAALARTPMAGRPRPTFAITPVASVVSKVWSRAGGRSPRACSAGWVSRSRVLVSGPGCRAPSNCWALRLSCLSLRCRFLCYLFGHSRQRQGSKNRHQRNEAD